MFHNDFQMQRINLPSSCEHIDVVWEDTDVQGFR